ncbi:MAG TPA: LON peptidase substrate-binding domain-containing protein, partial [Chthoniobacterales bacterium]|nr:LON peptidase substrate-binding domain-containing protein [Chthoniobacterales bacterium]
VPVMPLPGAVLFPHALLPLYIFEPRYRAMLARALSDDRMLCVTLLKPHRSDWQLVDDFYHIAAVGLIRACVGRGDGTSNLILQGMQRVRFRGFDQESPFPIAQIEEIPSEAPDSEAESYGLGRKLLELYEEFKGRGRQFPEKVDRYLSDLTDPEMLADLMAATFISEPTRRQQLLEERSVTERLRMVIQFLREETDRAA